jgi:GTPase Era involved in 16S rRNA processing
MTARTGTLAVIGRPNVGKSTLTNRLVGAKISITSRKAQTTRHQVRGILTTDVGGDDCQFVFVDTPGFQSQHKNALNRLMNRSVTTALAGVDVVLGRRRTRNRAPAAERSSGAAGHQQGRPIGRQVALAAFHREDGPGIRVRRDRPA